MIDLIADAFGRQDYDTAARLLQQLRQQDPQSPWIRLYAGRLQEVQQQIPEAEASFRQVLRTTTNPKVAMQARQGLQRLEALQKVKRQEAIAQAASDPANTGNGFLVIEPIQGAARRPAAQEFARIMKLDPYTAQMQLPSRGWRLYRTGAMGTLQVYGQELQQAEIPSFWLSLAAIEKVRVFRVQCLQAVNPQPTVVCQNEQRQMGSLTFDWSEVSAQVIGRLPIFEDVIDVGAWNRLKHKEQTLDYAQMYDLHLPERNCILRFCDNTYQFRQGMVFNQPHTNGYGETIQGTNRLNWTRLLKVMQHRLSHATVWDDFTTFAETALEHLDLVSPLKSHIDLIRKAESNWDPAFQLYSSMVFLHPARKP